MKYADILAEGEAAFDAGEPRNANPYQYQSIAWYAWDNVWVEARGADSKLRMEGHKHEQD